MAFPESRWCEITELVRPSSTADMFWIEYPLDLVGTAKDPATRSLPLEMLFDGLSDPQKSREEFARPREPILCKIPPAEAISFLDRAITEAAKQSGSRGQRN